VSVVFILVGFVILVGILTSLLAGFLTLLFILADLVCFTLDELTVMYPGWNKGSSWQSAPSALLLEKS